LKEAEAYGLSKEDFHEYKQLFWVGAFPGAGPSSLSDQELASKSYRSWPYHLLQGPANT